MTYSYDLTLYCAKFTRSKQNISLVLSVVHEVVPYTRKVLQKPDSRNHFRNSEPHVVFLDIVMLFQNQFMSFFMLCMK